MHRPLTLSYLLPTRTQPSDHWNRGRSSFLFARPSRGEGSVGGSNRRARICTMTCEPRAPRPRDPPMAQSGPLPSRPTGTAACSPPVAGPGAHKLTTSRGAQWAATAAISPGAAPCRWFVANRLLRVGFFGQRGGVYLRPKRHEHGLYSACKHLGARHDARKLGPRRGSSPPCTLSRASLFRAATWPLSHLTSRGCNPRSSESCSAARHLTNGVADHRSHPAL